MTEENESRGQGSGEVAWNSLVAESSVFSGPIQQAIGRAVLDPQFRDQLFRDPEAASAGRNLDEQDLRWLAMLDRRLFDAVVSDLEKELAHGLEREDRVAELIRQEARGWARSLEGILDNDEDLEADTGAAEEPGS